MNIFITGATGFVGKATTNALVESGHSVKAFMRQEPSKEFKRGFNFVIGSFPEKLAFMPIPNYDISTKKRFKNLSPSTSKRLTPKITQTAYQSIILDNTLRKSLQGIDTVVHCAARVHVMNETVDNPMTAFLHMNRDVTLFLARRAANSGVKRFVFLSSIKVNGERTEPDHPFTAADTPLPEDPYGQSKHLAEQALLELAKHTSMEIVIIRPPLVYGPGVKANFAKMIQWINKGIPLPLGAINNRRSLVALDNLVDLICTCADRERSPNAKREVLLVSDGFPVSVTELLKNIANAYGKKNWLIPVPAKLISFIAQILGKKAISDRLIENLEVDITSTQQRLNWKPPVSMQAQLEKMASEQQKT